MNLHRLDLFSLSLFSLVARSGSISKGAELALLAVGAASKRITDLEAAVGAELLERHSRGVTLTVAGQALQRHAQRILSDVDQLAADLSDYASGLVGVVRLWANTSAVTQFLPLDISTFVNANPGIRIELEEEDSSEVVLAVLDGRADFGIFADRTPALGLQVLNYREDRLVLVVPRGHALARRRAVRFEEAVEYDFVCLSKGTSLAQRLQSETEALGRRLEDAHPGSQLRRDVPDGRGRDGGGGPAGRSDPASCAVDEPAADRARGRVGEPTAPDRAARRERRSSTCAHC